MKERIVADPLALSLTWENGRLVRLNVHWATAVTESPVLSDEARLLKQALIRYVSGLDPEWPNLPFDLSRLTEFQRTVLHALARVPAGTTCTYGELAERVGNPQAARAIGRAMATNPFPLVYPCHRVVGATGKLTGFSGEGGLKLKERLLRLEGAL
jgi:methylated-DNA-[protein]-cysteine S-methyltransferase